MSIGSFRLFLEGKKNGGKKHSADGIVVFLRCKKRKKKKKKKNEKIIKITFFGSRKKELNYFFSYE